MEATNEYTELGNEINKISVLDPLFSSKVAEVVLKAKECGEYIGRCNQLNDLFNDELQELENIASEMRGLTD